ELQLARSLPDCVALVARQANAEGRGRLTIRDLVRLALRRSPTRIIVGEVRGGEALDMLDAMNTGHDGSGCTIHANSPRQALSKLATYALRTEERVPRAAIDEIIADTIQLVVQLRREPLTGHRRATHIFEVTGSREAGGIAGQDLWLLAPERGTLAWTGVRPRCLAQIRAAGLPYHLPRQEG
ncbi:MAG TPA: CpaF/VirB11 family protein, partial [Thermomicrobiales bacterium]|nr:CpaF/VirB11 family protein [Thermomicrobiales bacterium]